MKKAQITQLNEVSVCTAAIKKTGLIDFGDPYFRDGLLQLLHSAENDGKLSLFGYAFLHEIIVTNLAALTGSSVSYEHILI